MESLKEDLDMFRQQGLIEVPVSFDKLVDTSFVDWAVKDLGAYVKK